MQTALQGLFATIFTELCNLLVLRRLQLKIFLGEIGFCEIGYDSRALGW
jgi:hypothetical protein